MIMKTRETPEGASAGSDVQIGGDDRGRGPTARISIWSVQREGQLSNVSFRDGRIDTI